MPYRPEMNFLHEILMKCRLQMLVLDLAAPADHKVDLGLRKMLGWETDYETGFYDLFRQAEHNLLYRVTDQFYCSYMYCRLPQKKEEKVVVFGPYLGVELLHDNLLKEAEENGVPSRRLRQMESYYAGIPVLLEGNAVFAVIEAFADKIWGGAEAYRLTDINRELYSAPPQTAREDDRPGPEETAWTMQNMEQRYAMENELMRAVSLGLTHKVDMLLMSFSKLSFEQRLSDSVRNLKNYCIVMNTLLRKAAESGGVHPLYLDRMSSDFARKIETLANDKAVFRLMEDMFRAYCRLVNKHTTKNYSPPVQKAVIQIDMDLGGDLSLKYLAQQQGINASYLSSLFRKETGQTVTDYVNQKRMRMAVQLLGTTQLQIQTVAQRCGIPDVNYFSKLFKKYTQRTPKEYRQLVKLQLMAKEPN